VIVSGRSYVYLICYLEQLPVSVVDSHNNHLPRRVLLAMPSVFTRRAPSNNTPLPAGTAPSPSASALPILSTGIPSLDDILGSGQPLSSILSVLAPDAQSAWGKLIARYYIAEGLALGQDVIVVGGNDKEDLEELVKGCMWMEESAKRVAVMDANAKDPGNADGDDSDAEGLADDLDSGNRTRIAWRYDNMKKFETSVSSRAGSSCE
jgi:elongator complex protein 4